MQCYTCGKVSVHVESLWFARRGDGEAVVVLNHALDEQAIARVAVVPLSEGRVLVVRGDHHAVVAGVRHPGAVGV